MASSQAPACTVPDDAAEAIPIYPQARPLLPGEVAEVFLARGHGYVRLIGRWVRTRAGVPAFLPAEKVLDSVGVLAVTGWSYPVFRDRAWRRDIPGLITEHGSGSPAPQAPGRRPARKVRVWAAALVEALVGELDL